MIVTTKNSTTPAEVISDSTDFHWSTLCISAPFADTETPVKEPEAPPAPDTDEPLPGTDEPPAEPAPGPDEYPEGNPCEPGPCRW